MNQACSTGSPDASRCLISSCCMWLGMLKIGYCLAC